MSYNDFKSLINKKVKSATFTDKELTFTLEDGSEVKYYAVGDCCSQSYIEDIDNPEIFNNAVFLSADDESGETIEREEFDVLKWTFYKFKTDKGMATLSFRNESNGYYDGHLSLSEDGY